MTENTKPSLPLPRYIAADPILYAGFLHLYRRGTVRVLEESDDGVFVQDTRGVSYMLAAERPELAASWLNKHAGDTFYIMLVTGDGIADLAQRSLGFTERLDMYQAVYENSAPPVCERRLRIVPAVENDLDFIKANYGNLDEEELTPIIRNRQIYIGYNEDGERVGFIGQHMEGSIGLLEILPEHRRHGYATELECYMIDKVLGQGLIPYCHFKPENTASRELQKKLGMTITEKTVAWLF